MLLTVVCRKGQATVSDHHDHDHDHDHDHADADADTHAYAHTHDPGPGSGLVEATYREPADGGDCHVCTYKPSVRLEEDRFVVITITTTSSVTAATSSSSPSPSPSPSPAGWCSCSICVLLIQDGRIVRVGRASRFTVHGSRCKGRRMGCAQHGHGSAADRHASASGVWTCCSPLGLNWGGRDWRGVCRLDATD